MARPNKKKVLERLKKALDAIPNLQKLKRESPEFEKWHRNTEIAIENAFGEKSRHVNDFESINYSANAIYSLENEPLFQKAYIEGLNSATAILQSMIEEVEDYWEDKKNIYTETKAKSKKVDIKNIKVFIVHGHNEAKKWELKDFLTRLGLEVIILHEQDDKGFTIIEKFEHYAKECSFAFILMTPDDQIPDINEKEIKWRSRQNVILEMGWFMSHLGRERVILLLQGSIDIPSDISGVLYIPFKESVAECAEKIRQRLENIELIDKHTDLSRIKNKKTIRFNKIKNKMPSLISEIKEDLSREGFQFVREFFIMSKKWQLNISQKDKYFCYYFEDHEDLKNKMIILENIGYITDITSGKVKTYRMTEEFVELILEK